MERKEIEEKVKHFLIEDLEIDEDKIAPGAKLKDDLGQGHSIVVCSKP